MKYPELRSISSDAGGASLTLPVVNSAMREMRDPERVRQRAEYNERLTDDLNLRAKTYWARLHGKTVDELTSKDMGALNDSLFRGWLKYKGISERDFNEFFGF